MQKEIHNELWDREQRASIQMKGEVEINGQKIPDPKLHQTISFIKSGIRILGYCFIPFNLVVSAILLILSEIVGIIEELV